MRFYTSRSIFRRLGFTMVEILIVVAVTATLSSFLLVYNNNSRQRIVLFVEQAKIAQIILKAKSLSISTYANSGITSCGYGVKFDYENRMYSIFRYDYSDNCENLRRTNPDIFNDPSGAHIKPVEGLAFTMPTGVVFDTGHSDAITYVLFVPPDPRTIVQSGESIGGSGSVYLKSADGGSTATVSVGAAGQVNY